MVTIDPSANYAVLVDPEEDYGTRRPKWTSWRLDVTPGGGKGKVGLGTLNPSANHDREDRQTASWPPSPGLAALDNLHRYFRWDADRRFCCPVGVGGG